MVASWPEELPYWVQLDLDWRVAAFTAGSWPPLAAALSGLLPAWRSSRPDLVSDLRDGVRGATGAGAQRLQSALVVGQVALSLALLVGARPDDPQLPAAAGGPFRVRGGGAPVAPLLRRGRRLRPLPSARRAPARRSSSVVSALPGVKAAAVTSSIPTDDGGAPVRLAIERRPVPPGEEPRRIRIAASPALFETLGAPLVEGRSFTAPNTPRLAADVVIVNQALARRFWPEGALGQRLACGRGRTPPAAPVRWLRVVGVAPDIQYEEFGEETAAVAPQRVPAVRRRPQPLARAPGADEPRRRARRPRPSAASSASSTPASRSGTSARCRRFGPSPRGSSASSAHLMGAFAAQALLLACLGVYGVLAYAVSRRIHEIGVRLALGARPTDVVRLVLRRGAALGLLGTAVGLLLSLAVGRALQGVLYGVEPVRARAAPRHRWLAAGRRARGELAAGPARRGRRSGRGPARRVGSRRPRFAAQPPPPSSAAPSLSSTRTVRSAPAGKETLRL